MVVYCLFGFHMAGHERVLQGAEAWWLARVDGIGELFYFTLSPCICNDFLANFFATHTPPRIFKYNNRVSATESSSINVCLLYSKHSPIIVTRFIWGYSSYPFPFCFLRICIRVLYVLSQHFPPRSQPRPFHRATINQHSLGTWFP